MAMVFGPAMTTVCDAGRLVTARLKCEDADSDDTLRLEISDPNIKRDANSVVYIWDVKCCDNHGACDEAWLMTDNYIKGDVNNDQVVDFKDLAVLANHWLMDIN
jgi:hypothetical protein